MSAMTDLPDHHIGRRSPVSPASVGYRVDAQGRVCWVSHEWMLFAVANGARELTPQAVLGRPVADFVAGGAVRVLWARLFSRLRERDAGLSLSCRCDAPGLRRFVTATLAGTSAAREVEVEMRLEREEPRPVVPMLAAGSVRSFAWVRLCSWCQRVEAGDGDWREAEDVALAQGLYTAAVQPAIAHALCPDCDIRIETELDGAT